ncbi:MAG: site-2 protease family protein [Pirellulales bacterium]
MLGNWKLGRWFGIDVYVHWTLWALLGWLIWTGLASGQSGWAVLGGAGLTASVFACVLLHEFGHALTARQMGIPTREITLMPIGGVARLARMPEKPWQEILVALAGPAVNLVILVVLFGGWWLLGGNWDVAWRDPLFRTLAQANGMLMLFNLLPIFPMDGGRVLRAVLGLRWTYVQATRVAARVGQVAAVGLGVIGLFYNPMLVILAGFVFLAGRAELEQAGFREQLRGWLVRDAMLTRFLALPAYARLERVAAGVLSVAQSEFPVVHEGMLLGMLRRRELMDAVAQGRLQETVSQIMHTDFATVPADMPLADAVHEGWERGEIFLPVVDGHRLLGLLDITSASESLAAREQLPSPAPARLIAQPID